MIRFLLALACLSLVACGASPTPTPEPTEEPAPPTATPEPSITRAEIESLLAEMLAPVAPQPTLQPSDSGDTGDNGQKGQPNGNAGQAGGEAATLVPTVTPVPTEVVEPTIVPTRTPRPTATPLWRPAPKPQGVTNYGGFDITSGPTISGAVLRMSAVIDGQGITPSEVQVWQALRRDDDAGKCPTHKPIALIADNAAGGSSAIQWSYCSYIGSRPVLQVDSVPWLEGSWLYSERSRRRTTDPYLADWSISVSLLNEDVEALEYPRPEGYYIVVFAGDLLLARVWVDAF